MSVFVFFLAVSLRRRSEIRRLTDEIDEVLNLGRRLSFSNCREGDIAVLANELEKMVARLSRLTSQIENEKTALADSLADISHQIRTPLTAAELMLPAIERATDEEQRKRLARDLEHLLDRVSWLVATLLKMAKVDARGTAYGVATRIRRVHGRPRLRPTRAVPRFAWHRACHRDSR